MVVMTIALSLLISRENDIVDNGRLREPDSKGKQRRSEKNH